MIDKRDTEAVIYRTAVVAFQYYPDRKIAEPGYTIDEDLAWIIAPLRQLPQAQRDEIQERALRADPRSHRRPATLHPRHQRPCGGIGPRSTRRTGCTGYQGHWDIGRCTRYDSRLTSDAESVAAVDGPFPPLAICRLRSALRFELRLSTAHCGHSAIPARVTADCRSEGED